MAGFQEVSAYRFCADKSGHAVRMAIDMGVNDAFGKLLRSGMGANKTGADLEKERNLVVQARVWFCVSPAHQGHADVASCT